MQTAMKSHLQWLYDNQLELNIPFEVIEDAEDRLEMEKQQLGYTWDSCIEQGIKRAWNISRLYTDFDDFYNETFINED